MYVKLLAHTPDPEKLVAAAAKLCYSTCSIDDLLAKQDDEKVAKFLNHLMTLGHESPLEHVTFTFGIEGVSRSLLAQISRHRIASFSVQSQRYCNLENTFSYITPDAITEDDFANVRFENAMKSAYESYVALSDYLQNKYEEQGMDSKTAEKKAIEDARAVLPNACETKMMITMNVRSLRHFFELRCCNRAQDEIRNLAWEMLDQCKAAAPLLFKGSGPTCIAGKCSEGKMSCGSPYTAEDK